MMITMRKVLRRSNIKPLIYGNLHPSLSLTVSYFSRGIHSLTWPTLDLSNIERGSITRQWKRISFATTQSVNFILNTRTLSRLLNPFSSPPFLFSLRFLYGDGIIGLLRIQLQRILDNFCHVLDLDLITSLRNTSQKTLFRVYRYTGTRILRTAITNNR